MKQRLVLWLPTALFICILCLQVYFTQTANLNAWRGGGFGMFATIDSQRRLRVVGYDQDNNAYQVSFNSSRLKKQWVLKDTINALERFPHPARLQKFANSLLDYSYVASGLREKHILEKSRKRPDEPRVEFEASQEPHAPYIRLVTPHEKVPDRTITLDKLSLSVWRLHFDQTQSKLSWKQLDPEIHATQS